ncbi:aminopeptidase P family protein [Aquipuribacter sp. SD81]|uniref:aminopeptidase P family protein n=1 Tax=Aquipuribacter sp. SD81 TaxID=3127703 RepID=UPI00301A5806
MTHERDVATGSSVSGGTPAAGGHPTGQAGAGEVGTPSEGVASSGGRSQRPSSRAFREFVASGWGPRPDVRPETGEGARRAVARREALSARFPGDRLVVPAGGLQVRSNDTDHRFRPHTAFAYLTGLGGDTEPDCVLVLEPVPGGSGGHEAVLFFRPRAGRDTEEFYADARYGELWVGRRASLAEVEAATGVHARHLDDLPDAVAKGLGEVVVRVVRDGDPAVTDRLDAERLTHDVDLETAVRLDDDLADAVSAQRCVKDDWEVEQLREAVAATVRGFEDIARSLPRAVAHARGERVIEGVFAARAREEGNGVGYEVIAASGEHACTLHWIRNDGEVRADDLVLVDAGVEADSLYTADVTRTLPVSGAFSEPQRRVYTAVLDAADAAFAATRPGATIREVHQAAMQVLAERLADWGLLPVDAATSLDPQEGGQHRRWMVHGTSHHLGLDVHDCARLARETYQGQALEAGMVFTIEPGLYFRTDDLLVPEELRGLGVRIEDDVLVTADGCENLSAALPREPDAVEAWLADVQGR